MKVKFLIIGLSVLPAFFGNSFEMASAAHPESNLKTPSWLWGGTTDSSLGLPSLNTASGLGWISINSHNPNTNPGASYGLNVPAGNGLVTGHGWSSNVGWVDFQPTRPFPGSGCGNTACPTWSSRREGDKLTGWARIVSIKDAFEAVPSNSGSWQGWVKLSGSNYGVVVDESLGKISGFAWSNELGWIEFNAKIDTGVTPPPPAGGLPPPIILPPGPPGPPPIILPPGPPGGLPPPIGPFPILSCSGSPNPSYLSTGGIVTWKVEGGSVPYSWRFSADAAPISGLGTKEVTVKYASVGIKTASVNAVECKMVNVKRFRICETIPFVGDRLCP